MNRFGGRGSQVVQLSDSEDYRALLREAEALIEGQPSPAK
jgi:hypothetical protein